MMDSKTSSYMTFPGLKRTIRDFNLTRAFTKYYDIQREVEKYRKVRFSTFKQSKRLRDKGAKGDNNESYTKQLFLYLVYPLVTKDDYVTTTEVVRMVKLKSHSSLYHGYKKISDLMDVDKTVREDVETLQNRINKLNHKTTDK